MPSTIEHIEKAKKNQIFVDLLAKQKQTPHDWYVVGLFYEVVHFLEAVSAKEIPSIHHFNHKERKKYLANHSDQRIDVVFRKRYKELYMYSIQARYEVDGLIGKTEANRALHVYTYLSNTLKAILGI